MDQKWILDKVFNLAGLVERQAERIQNLERRQENDEIEQRGSKTDRVSFWSLVFMAVMAFTSVISAVAAWVIAHPAHP